MKINARNRCARIALYREAQEVCVWFLFLFCLAEGKEFYNMNDVCSWLFILVFSCLTRKWTKTTLTTVTRLKGGKWLKSFSIFIFFFFFFFYLYMRKSLRYIHRLNNGSLGNIYYIFSLLILLVNFPYFFFFACRSHLLRPQTHVKRKIRASVSYTLSAK